MGRWRLTGRTPRPRRRSAATTSSRPPIWTRRRRSRWDARSCCTTGWSRCVRRMRSSAEALDNMRQSATAARCSADVPGVLDHLFRRQAGQVVATLTRILGPRYLELAEDATQEALIRALRRWPLDGVPDNPAGWIAQVARRAALDALRRERMLREKRELLACEVASALVGEPVSPDALDHQLRDDQLRMLF